MEDVETVVKQRGAPLPGFFEVEAAGLRWLADAGGARCARVLDVTSRRIELERVTPVTATPDAAYAFGRGLARTHLAGADAFGSAPAGWSGPLYIGERPMPRSTAATWGDFYAHARVLPFVEDALAAGNLEVREARTVRQACDVIASGVFDDDDPPARIHGDLWSGNVLFGAKGAVLIDPAAHGGHAETDLAMLALFGAPHLDDIVAGYEEVSPLRPGWRTRVLLHQMHPLAVHAVGHGRMYGAALARAARAVVNAR
ncbi:fructosamine kinase family protein [Demequina capsici]|uniref:fructosamine kinase family protein n=1 Tax=Demequina capsici TaxID=3075620 RepID=UPI003F68B57D